MRALLTILADSTERLDRFLADQLDLSRTQAARLIAQGAVTVNGERARASHQLHRGDALQVAFPEDEPPRRLVPSPIPLSVVFEDEYLAVVDKPAGLVVHPAPGHWEGTLVNALVARGTTLSGGAAGRPGIVHRLDRDTSGLMVVAKTDQTHRRLSRALAARRIRRTYAALVWGHLATERLTVEAPIGRHSRDRKRMVVRADGRPSTTHVEVVARLAVADLLRVRLETGRTHQIRVHLHHIGHPVVGDPVYHGGGRRRVTTGRREVAAAMEEVAPRQVLHAAELALSHPVTGAPLVFRSHWPQDLMPVLGRALGDPDRIAEAEPLHYLRFFTR